MTRMLSSWSVPGAQASLSEQGNDPRLDIVAFEYQVLRLGALKMVRLPPPPLPRGNAPLFINVLSLSLPQALTGECVF